MKRLSFAVLGVLAAGACANFASVGCGSEDSAIVDPGEAGGDEGGGKDDANGPGTDSGAKDAFIDAITDGGRDPDSATCKPVITACTKSTECCTANCDAASGKCANPSTLCALPGATCVTGNQCCTGSCTGGSCSSLQCVADNAACAADGECCSQQCVPNGVGGGVCKPLGAKPVSGNPCAMNSDCASGWCNNGICANPSFCTVDNDICSTDQQCCGGSCSKAAGALVGICKIVTGGGNIVGGACLPAGELCSPNGTCTGSNCCSRSCAPSPTSGLGVCQPESGCHIIGDLCTSTGECCGVSGLPGSIKGGAGGPSTDVQCQKAAGQTFGLCNYVKTVCSPAGALCKPGLGTIGGAMSCSTKADCCAGNDNQTPSCQVDANGIPRCLIMPVNCAAGTPPAGTQCATSADCCGSPCIPNADPGTVATKPYVCGTPGQCQQQGMTCASTSDCCTGLPCAVPPGSVSGFCGGTLLPDGGVAPTPPPGTDGGVVQPPDGGSGTCALYGQTCATSPDCCSGVPCTNGTCHYP